ncbi:hypothetical protein KC973_02645 [Candidatus Saccharibacteria bacterium]|nr:hypothetical protein [Candidatus Saccharibacteria bacterium]
MSTGTKKRFALHNGVELIIDWEAVTYHDRRETHHPTAQLHFVRGSVKQADATKAAHRVDQSVATVTKSMIEISTTHAVRGYAQAQRLVETFVDELDALLRSREQGARNTARQAGRGGYVNIPQG